MIAIVKKYGVHKMKIIDVDQNSIDWLEARKGKITGSKLKDIVVKRGNGHKVGFYQLIADRIFDGAPSEEDDRERGHSLEDEAAQRFTAETGKELRRVGLLVSDLNPNIAVSPDRVVVGSPITEHVEIKCLGDARHVEAVLTDSVPKDYYPQVVQNFIVNEDLKTLYLVFYSDRTQLPKFQYHCITVNREDVTDDIEWYRDYQLKTIEEINGILEQYVF